MAVYGLNLISELDTINEYYLDSMNKKVYISKQRQSALAADEYYISVNHYPVLVSEQERNINGETDRIFGMTSNIHLEQPLHQANLV